MNIKKKQKRKLILSIFVGLLEIKSNVKANLNCMLEILFLVLSANHCFSFAVFFCYVMVYSSNIGVHIFI